MELNKLYNIAEKENIDIINFKMKNKAIIGCLDNNYTIGINYSNIDNSSEEKTILAEELGHYYTSSLYTNNSSLETISRKEFKAQKWAFQVLAPYKKIKELYEEGYRYTYEFAEELGITEDLLDKAYSYYKENNYI